MPSDKAMLKPWTYKINYGPDNEQDYANVYDEIGMFVGNFRLHQAIRLVKAANTTEALADTMRVIEMAEKALQYALQFVPECADAIAAINKLKGGQ